MRDVHRTLERSDHVGVLDMPSPADEDHAGVEKQEDEDRDHAQPVEKVVALHRSDS